MLTHRGPRDADTEGRHQGRHLSCTCTERSCLSRSMVLPALCQRLEEHGWCWQDRWVHCWPHLHRGDRRALCTQVLSLWHLLQSMRPACHSSGGTVATHKPLLCSRVGKGITYSGPELNHRNNCSNVLMLGEVVPALCVHLQLCIPTSHLHVLPLQQHCHKPTSHLCQMCCFTAFSFEAPCACALTSRAVTGRLPARASCLGPTSLTFTVFT